MRIQTHNKIQDYKNKTYSEIHKFIYTKKEISLCIGHIHSYNNVAGATGQKKRQLLWKKYRVIFATPQVFHKDLEKNILPGDLVKCVVVDEAHRALGKHSYCEV